MCPRWPDARNRTVQFGDRSWRRYSHIRAPALSGAVSYTGTSSRIAWQPGGAPSHRPPGARLVSDMGDDPRTARSSQPGIAHREEPPIRATSHAVTPRWYQRVRQCRTSPRCGCQECEGRRQFGLFLPTSPEPRHQAAQPAPDVLAGVSGDPAKRVVVLDDPQILYRRAHGTSSGD
jgi:hypothetical protein